MTFQTLSLRSIVLLSSSFVVAGCSAAASPEADDVDVAIASTFETQSISSGVISRATCASYGGTLSTESSPLRKQCKSLGLSGDVCLDMTNPYYVPGATCSTALCATTTIVSCNAACEPTLDVCIR